MKKTSAAQLIRQALEDYRVMLTTRKCPVCGGPVEVIEDEDEIVARCLVCGQEHAASRGFFEEN